jgi:hypothetical protein
MAATDGRGAETAAGIRRELQVEREALARAVETLRESTDVMAPVRARLPLALAGAFAVGFVASGGLGATVRLLFRRRREGRTKARVGPLSLVDRR